MHSVAISVNQHQQEPISTNAPISGHKKQSASPRGNCANQRPPAPAVAHTLGNQRQSEAIRSNQKRPAVAHTLGKQMDHAAACAQLDAIAGVEGAPNLGVRDRRVRPDALSERREAACSRGFRQGASRLLERCVQVI